LVRTHTKLLEHFGLPTAVPRGIRTDDVINALRYNKRHLTEGCRMALLSDVGKLWCVEGDYAIPVSEQVLRKALEATRSELF
jgi:3-dehydroquinate synthetase